MEGPFDKTITFLAVEERPLDIAIPTAFADIDALAYLGGRTLGELIDAEQVATSSALARRGRMNMTIRLPRVNAHAIGQLFMMLEIATIYAGVLYDVDPLDQPGVELGKELTYGLMGRAGFDRPEDQTSDPRHVCR
jgi:glucose-6-phosphate isomerase